MKENVMLNWFHDLRRFVGRAAASLPPRPGRRRATARPKVEALEERQVLSGAGKVIFIFHEEPGQLITMFTLDATEKEFKALRDLVDGATATMPVTASLINPAGELPVLLFPDQENPGKIVVQLNPPVTFPDGHTGLDLQDITLPGLLAPLRLKIPKVEIAVDVGPQHHHKQHHHHHHHPGIGGFNGFGGIGGLG
jgi:hypothetical protein